MDFFVSIPNRTKYRPMKGKILFFSLLLYSIGLQATAFPSRTDFRDESIYFVMTTRFYNGDPSNDTQCWDAQQYNVGDPAWRGDFKGLIQQMDYIKALGFTAIWITPIVTNGSGYDYHGYHAMNFSEVDKRYESEDVLFQDVIDAAHARGMKIILDIVLNHTGNFGEENLCKLFTRDWNADQSAIDECMVPYTQKDGGGLPDDYLSLPGGSQYAARLAEMKNTDGQNHDTHNYWHHVGNNWGWDDYSRVWGQIAGDCVDLNTENPYVADYLVRCYGEFIKMGVDGFRIDTSGHIARLTFNNHFIPQFKALAEQYRSKRNGGDFFMFGEVCARSRQVIYRDGNINCSPFYYTWKETTAYPWDNTAASWDNLFIKEGEFGSHTNAQSVLQQGKDDTGKGNIGRYNSTNAFLNGNAYHTPDYSQSSGFSVIDFPMHWNFAKASDAWSIRNGDKYYNDATWNVVYVDSHDYAPDGAPESERFNQSQDTWAENLSLMFTFRGIPCIYYGSEIEFKKGKPIDKGPNIALQETGRAYFGGYLSGYVITTDFGEYEEACGNMAQTLQHPLARHIRRLSKIRMAVPALRKGQYSTEGCSGSFAFKRRYTDATTDSYALVCISGNGTFTGVENGTYVDCVTGDTKTVTNGTLNATCSGKGNMRVYVLSTQKTPAPGKIGTDGNYLYVTGKANIGDPKWDGKQEALDPRFGDNGGGSTGGGSIENPTTPCLETADERCVFFQAPSGWGKSANVYMWINGTETNLVGTWPGKAATALGGGAFKFNIPADATSDETKWMIIWNGANGQTKDLSFTMRGLYTGDNKDNVSCTSIVTTLCADVPQPEEPAEPEPEPDPTPDYPEEEPCTGALPDPEPHSSESSGNDQPWGIHNVDSNLLLYTEQGTLYIGSETAQHVCIYSVDGTLVLALDLQAGITTVNLPQGFYMVNSQKVVI